MHGITSGWSEPLSLSSLSVTFPPALFSYLPFSLSSFLCLPPSRPHFPSLLRVALRVICPSSLLDVSYSPFSGVLQLLLLKSLLCVYFSMPITISSLYQDFDYNVKLMVLLIIKRSKMGTPLFWNCCWSFWQNVVSIDCFPNAF